MARVIRAETAQADARDIWSYIAQDSVVAADRLLDHLNNLFERLADQPYLGRSVEDHAPGLHCVPHGNYLVFYRPIKDGVQIVRLLHGARDITADLFRE